MSLHVLKCQASKSVDSDTCPRPTTQDGVIIGKSQAPVVTSTYCLTKRHFTDFRLVIDVKLVESEMHSGISLWGHAQGSVALSFQTKGYRFSFKVNLV